jgi:AcrR family transcriptional regulator
VSARTTSRAGRQRSEAADEAILSATLDVLAEEGYAGFTVAAVIQRSGVSSATLYRRWATKEDLVVAALAGLHPEPVAIDTGTFDGDIAALVAAMARTMSVRRDDLAGVLAGELRRDAELRAAVEAKFLAPRLALLSEILDRASERGELSRPPRVEIAWSLVAGPLHHRAYARNEPLTPEFLAAATVAVTAGLRAVADT